LLNTDEALPQPGEPAPDFEFTRADGSTQRLSDLQGKKVVLNFWATWCTPCRDEMPALSQAASEQPDTLVVLGVNKNESVAKIATFAEEIPVVFPLIANPDGTISERYRISAIPVTYFIHTDGTIALRHTGVLDYAKLQEQLANVR
jgi:peroxiredoxin